MQVRSLAKCCRQRIGGKGSALGWLLCSSAEFDRSHNYGGGAARYCCSPERGNPISYRGAKVAVLGLCLCQQSGCAPHHRERQGGWGRPSESNDQTLLCKGVRPLQAMCISAPPVCLGPARPR